MSDRIELLLDSKRVGITISKIHFDLLSDFIIKEVSESEEMTLTQLIALPQIVLPEFIGDYTWHLLQVKRHLEVIGIIENQITRLRIQLIKKVNKSPTRYAMYG